jgi:integrase
MGRQSATSVAERMAVRRQGSKRYVGGLPNARSATPLGKYLSEEWLPAVRSEIEPSTYVGLQYHIRAYINPRLGNVPICDIDREMLRAFYRELLRTPMSRKSGLLSKGSVINIHATLSWAFQTLLESRRISSNPAWGIRPRVKKSERYEPKIWTPAQLFLFLDAVKTDELFPLWSLLALTGMRRSEALGLQWGDFSADWKYVGVRRALCEAGSSAYITVPKAASGRRINLLQVTAIALRHYRRQQQRRRRSHKLKSIRPQDFLFKHLNGKLFRPNWTTKRFYDLVKKSDLPKIRLHDLRHTHASHLLEAGANLKAVQERLGHADPVFTIDTYVHLMPTIQAEAIKSLRTFYSSVVGEE